MKAQSRWLIACTGICLVSATALANIQFGLSASENDYNTLQANVPSETRYSQGFSNSRELIGATVRDPQGQKLGRVHEIVLSPRNGEAFAAISVGHGTYALVPLQALSVTSTTGLMGRRDEVTLNSTRETLENGPTITNGEWDRLDTPSFTQSIYSHYQMQPPSSAMGGVGASSLGGTSKSSDQNETSQPPQK